MFRKRGICMQTIWPICLWVKSELQRVGIVADYFYIDQIVDDKPHLLITKTDGLGDIPAKVVNFFGGRSQSNCDKHDS